MSGLRPSVPIWVLGHEGTNPVEGSTLVNLWVLIGNDRAWHFHFRHGWTFDCATKLVELGG